MNTLTDARVGFAGTALDEDFSSVRLPPTFADVYVDAVALTLISRSSPDFSDGIDLPKDLSFLDDIDPESSLFTIVLSGNGLDGDIPIGGDIDEVNDNPQPVPEPGSFAVLAIGLAGLLEFESARRRKS